MEGDYTIELNDSLGISVEDEINKSNIPEETKEQMKKMIKVKLG